MDSPRCSREGHSIASPIGLQDQSERRIKLVPKVDLRNHMSAGDGIMRAAYPAFAVLTAFIWKADVNDVALKSALTFFVAVGLLWMIGGNFGLKDYWRRNIRGYTLWVGRSHGGGIEWRITPRKTARYPLLEDFTPRIWVSLGGWFRSPGGVVRQPRGGHWSLRRLQRSRWCDGYVELELRDGDGSRFRGNAWKVVRIVEMFAACQEDGMGGINGVLGWLLKSVDQLTDEVSYYQSFPSAINRLVGTILTAADTLADTTRVGRSSEGKALREDLDRVLLEYLPAGDPNLSRIRRRLGTTGE